MINALWIIPISIISASVGGVLVGLFSGAKEPKCESCLLKHNAETRNYPKPPKGKSNTQPPPKHMWEITHADKPARNLYRKNGRRDKI